MLLEKSNQLIELSQKKVDLQKYARNQEGFRTRDQQITQSLKQVNDLVQPLRLFRQQGLIAADLKPVVEKLLKFVQDVLIKYKTNPEWILDNQNFDRTKFQSSIDRLTDKLKKQLLQSWQNYLTRKLPSTNPEFLNVLGQVDDFKPTIQKIRHLEEQIKLVLFPEYQEQFEGIEALIQQLNNTWNTINAENVPDEVLRFLEGAASITGASLDLLTPTVQLWVKEHHLSNTVRIRLS